MDYYYAVKSKIATLILFLIVTGSCRHQPDLEKEKAEIMNIHNQQRQAHMERNAALLVENASPDFLEVNRGRVKKPSKDESFKRFQAYFDAVEFLKWDDVTPPIFSFSDDATMVSTVVDKLVITKQKEENDRLDTAHYAWISIYKKRNGKWEMERIASTNR